MRIALSVFLIFVGIVSLATGWGAFAGIIFIGLGIAIWVWGVAGAQTDETIANLDPGEKKSSGIIDPNDPENRV